MDYKMESDDATGAVKIELIQRASFFLGCILLMLHIL